MTTKNSIALPKDVSDAVYICLGNNITLHANGSTSAHLYESDNVISVISSDASGFYGGITWFFGGRTVLTHPPSYDDEEGQFVRLTTQTFNTGKVEVTRHSTTEDGRDVTFPSRDPEGRREYVARIAGTVATLIRPFVG
jgi:hypothetical protein